MKEIPTAEEFLENKWKETKGKVGNYENILIEFAKLHVEAQREAIKEKAFVTSKETERGDEYFVNPKSIDDAYPLNNVK